MSNIYSEASNINSANNKVCFCSGLYIVPDIHIIDVFLEHNNNDSMYSLYVNTILLTLLIYF